MKPGIILKVMGMGPRSKLHFISTMVTIKEVYRCDKVQYDGVSHMTLTMKIIYITLNGYGADTTGNVLEILIECKGT
jgi:hypothetical protein